MMVSNRGSVLRLLLWQWRAASMFALSGAAAAVLHEVLGLTWLVLPALPVAVAGGALGIFVSFRTNSAYDRWWEGRKLWGRLVNTSRHFATQVLAYVPETFTPTRERLVRRHITYVHVLRCLLRGQRPGEDADVMSFLSEAERPLLELSNPTHLLLNQQLQDIAGCADEQILDGLRLQSTDQSVRELLDIQGGCERSKRTPIPRGDGFIASGLIVSFGLLLPYAIVKDLSWAVIPINVLVGLSFALISEAGRVLEDPFTLFWNGLPLTALSKTIETNLRELMGERDLPPIPGVNEQGILM